MANKDNKTKVNTKKDNGRIIKRNWWKIAIIVFVVVIILVGISVGLYFLLRPTYSLGSDNYVTNKDMSEISKDIRSGEEKDKAILFYDEESVPVKWITWDDLEGEDGDNADSKDSALNHVVNYENRTYYAVNLDDYDDKNEMLLDLFVDTSNDSETTDLYENFQSIIFGDLIDGTPEPSYYIDWTFASGDDTQAIEPNTGAADDWAKENALSFSVKNKKNSDDEWEHTFVNTETGTTPTINPGTLFYFDGPEGFLENVFSISAAPSQDDLDKSNDAKDNISYWFEELDSFKFSNI